MITSTSPTEPQYGRENLMTQTASGMTHQVLPGEHRKLLELAQNLQVKISKNKYGTVQATTAVHKGAANTLTVGSNEMIGVTEMT